MQPRGGHLCFDLVTARHNQTLGEKIESAHDCKTDKNSYKLENSSRKEQILFFAALPRLLPWLGKKYQGMISLVKRRHMMCHVKITKSREGRREENGTIIFPFDPYRGRRQSKTQKSDNNKQKKKTSERNKTKNKNKQKKAGELPVSLHLAGGRSRIQDNP